MTPHNDIIPEAEKFLGDKTFLDTRSMFEAAEADFVKEFASRFSKDRDRPFNKIDAGDIKRVLIAWAEAEEGV